MKTLLYITYIAVCGTLGMILGMISTNYWITIPTFLVILDFVIYPIFFKRGILITFYHKVLKKENKYE